MRKRFTHTHQESLVLFVVFISLVLTIGPVSHNHNWHIIEPVQCPAFWLEQVLSSATMLFFIIFLFFLALQFGIIRLNYIPLKSFLLSFVQINRPPPVLF